MDEENGTPAPEEQEDNSLEELKQKFEDQRKRAEKAEAEAREMKETLNSIVQEEQEQPEKLPTQEKNFGFDDLADNLAVLKPLEEDEVEELRSQARELDIDPIKFAQSKAWKAHLVDIRNNKKAENDTPESSHRTAVYEGKTFKDVVYSKDSSTDDKQAAFEAQRDALLKRGVNQNI